MNYRLSHSTAILPTGTRINLTKPEENEYYEDSLAYHVFRGVTASGKPAFRVISGAGKPDFWRIGEQVTFHHDQTFRDFGALEFVGSLHKGEVVGEVPDRKLTLSVLK